MLPTFAPWKLLFGAAVGQVGLSSGFLLCCISADLSLLLLSLTVLGLSTDLSLLSLSLTVLGLSAS
jgi:hypothetical protein